MGFLACDTPTVAAFVLSPIGLQQRGEGCDGRFVQPPPGGAIMFEFDLAWCSLCFQTVSLGVVKFARSGEAVVGTLLGVVLLSVFLRSLNSSDIRVANVA